VAQRLHSGDRHAGALGNLTVIEVAPAWMLRGQYENIPFFPGEKRAPRFHPCVILSPPA